MIPQAGDSAVPCSTRYCLFNHRKEYLSLVPAGSKAQIALPANGKRVNVEWFDPACGKLFPQQEIVSDGPKEFGAPFKGCGVLYLKFVAIQRPPTPAGGE